ncbi:Diphthami-syn-2 domain-containing protein [Mycena chlorophos]|uniref:Diphthine--ammonia ligase n=1 Tax=Mycena chlorophos TaxID=658473 RepID=A0A8H6S438_MYCCL|nr:Diphthami-syn-2 domain-containing protein [Mycena chlorophos]
MQYVALLSGGKDSCYNLLHCNKHGHTLVAAASLGPQPGKEELDSYMYQTVGQDAIELVARALDVPLYRRVISGQAIEQGSEYGPRSTHVGVSGDETEDLFVLLETVKAHHPEVQGVSVGAILSNYQRVRVEHVCRRLNLTPLCYLWQRDQGELMSEMIAAGMHSILIKVAGIGLTVDHLGRSLAQMEPTFIKLHGLYGAHICGEGGEYETLTLDCPMFKRRILLNEVETVIHSDNDFATVAFLRVKNAELQEKDDTSGADCAVPELLDEEWLAVRESVTHVPSAVDPPRPGSALAMSGVVSKEVNGWISVCNIVATQMEGISIEAEVQQCFGALQEELRRYSLDLVDCTNINIFLSSMDLFADVNAVYSTFFGTSPPSRACVAVTLPAPHHVILECIAHSRAAQRHALHVQSLSYWAPANIGPYSQAVLTDERVFVSGQIGLIPSTLSLPSPLSLALESALVGQHARRVVNALSVNTGGWTGHVQLALYWLADPADLVSVRDPLSSVDAAPTLFVAVESLPKSALIEKQILVHTGRVNVVDEDGEPVTETRTAVFRQGRAGPFQWETSVIPDGDSGCVLICGRDADGSHLSQLTQTEDLDFPLARALSVKVFYVPGEHSSVAMDVFEALFPMPRPPVTLIACKAIASRNSQWDYAICVLTV